ncbi:hypothetical protein J6590_068491 [Homalodisca vitripennis]|nr:hypothetical protein J6590_068491 [Homalodisca vitripennis]
MTSTDRYYSCSLDCKVKTVKQRTAVNEAVYQLKEQAKVRDPAPQLRGLQLIEPLQNSDRGLEMSITKSITQHCDTRYTDILSMWIWIIMGGKDTVWVNRLSKKKNT